MPSHLQPCPLLAAFAIAAALTAQTPSLLLDVNPAPGVGSLPSGAIVGHVDGELLVALDDGVHGTELWRTNGTTAGTTMVVDLVPGPGGCIVRSGTSVGGVTLVVLDRGSGNEVWRTDGTATGTFRLLGPAASLINPEVDPSGSGRFLVNAGNTWYATDGTLAGTTAIGVPGGVLLGSWLGLTWFHVPLGGDLYAYGGGQTFDLGPFAGTLSLTADGRWMQMVSDIATFSATLRRLDLPGQPSVTLPLFAFTLAIPDAFLVLTPTALLRWDGVTPPQALLNSAPNLRLVQFGSRWAFLASTPAYGTEPWITDGTPAGTQVLDLMPGPGSSSTVLVGEFLGKLLVWATRNATGNEPWLSDGTLAGTVSLGDLEPGAGSSLLAAFTPIGERRAVLAVQTSASGKEPWFTDGTVAGTHLLADIAPGPASSLITPGGFLTGVGWFAGDVLYFEADDGVHGREPWIVPLPGTREPLRRYGPSVFTTGDPVLGTNVELRCRALTPNELGVVAIGLPVPVCVPIAPLRCVHVDPTSATLAALVLGDAAGDWTGAIALQNLPATIGLDLVAQPVFLAPAMPLGLDVGDAVWWSLGI